MPPIGSVTGGWRNENECCLNMHPILRLWLEHKSMPFAELLRVSERISEDCSSSECAYRNRTCPRVSHYLLSLPDSSIKLSTELASPRVHLDTTAHHALIDVPDIYFGNILAQYAKPNWDRWSWTTAYTDTRPSPISLLATQLLSVRCEELSLYLKPRKFASYL